MKKIEFFKNQAVINKKIPRGVHTSGDRIHYYYLLTTSMLSITTASTGTSCIYQP